jgi:hypothetical protein
MLLRYRLAPSARGQVASTTFSASGRLLSMCPTALRHQEGLAKSDYSSFSRPPNSLSSNKSEALLLPTIFSVSITSPTFFSSSTCSVEARIGR